ncbi:4'-phosphopantetheinyl transferase superfamily protein [Kitasatospora sp. NBC_01246]|uniref:4'-phosphopantetheinyl transferase family protein n=1 Tax=Kitasatospora sp. NBC_01246 TaxID=2903570 RepID=UPI002E3549BB|nr:4'-phosphopantetheinyl transferase superfamily protein [Kitasatospora sp. NBC_01246]
MTAGPATDTASASTSTSDVASTSDTASTPDTADRVDLWTIPTDQPDEVVRSLRSLLDRDELARVTGRGPARDPVAGRRFTVVHGVVRLLVAERLGLHPAELAWRYGPHGKPEPAVGHERVGVSYSGSGALAVLALTAGRPVGVDVEEVHDARVATRVAERYFPGAEAEFLARSASPAVLAERFTTLWCRREACVKAYGGRLVQGFGLPLAGPAPLRLAHPGTLGEGPCLLDDVPVPGPFRAAVAVLGEQPFRLRRHRWKALSEACQPFWHRN